MPRPENELFIIDQPVVQTFNMNIVQPVFEKAQGSTNPDCNEYCSYGCE